jgi:glycosyltransferase involved in cell wall biosynthesis
MTETASMNAANAAIYYHPDGFDTSRPKLMGRQAAGEAFLRAFVRHVDAETVYCCAKTSQHFADFQDQVAPFAGSKSTKWIPLATVSRLGEPGCLIYPGPDIADLAWARRHGDQRRFSLCGVTHTTASPAVMDSIGALLLAPVQPWDAVICTSEAVKRTIRQVHDDWSDYLADRVGARPRPVLRLPVIPLGVDCDQFAASAETDAAGAGFRGELGIAEDDVAVLYVGRLSFHAKANPLPLYLGLEEAAKRSAKRLHLVLAGWFPNALIEKAFVDGAEQLCPSVNLIRLDGREARVRRFIWFAADIFASLSDNIQETFGLTPIEAMAAGLPVVATDWNGYRDTVRDGIDGFMVPTRMPPSGFGHPFALRQLLRVDSYDRYIGHTSQCVAVDVEAAAAAIARLATDAGLRRRMGAAGRKRARDTFDWSVVIRAYQDLWRDLAERRQGETETVPPSPGLPPCPLRADPFRLFAGYPSAAIEPDTAVVLTPGRRAADFPAISGVELSAYARALFAGDEDCVRLLDHLGEHGETRIRTLMELFPANERGKILRTVAWLAKLDLIRFR